MKRLLASLIVVAALLAPSVALADDSHISSTSGPVLPYLTRYSGYVYDADTGTPIAGVCVYAGPVGCPTPSLVTDSSGYWALDFPTGLSWDLHFAAAGYGSEVVTSATARTFVILAAAGSAYASGALSR